MEDESDVRLVTATYLREHAYEVVEAGDGGAARRALAEHSVDVVVLDLGLPDEDGLGLLRWVGDAAVVVVTGRGDEPDRVVGLELGADDYLVKPFSQRELIARIGAVLRRRRPAPDRLLRFGELVIDTQARETFVLERPVALTRLEYDLLVYLATRPGRSFTHEQLLSAVWESSSDWQSVSTVSEHVYRLRRKLRLEDGRPRISTVRGVGYRFDP